ncbi:hypothetical protein A2765_02590 [Candidatus Kaiserbacteria bacterium RIFCSPHIGHO2_01_FULL_56_24]|uniref:DUF541 domain-containing protein n=1 Tax=Candidatus Kaiserbacteria bacterium RIFCSPHIGHO2_01_FULL_56_24 TaxID=1798487 RepID=A0A1F6DB18_9BACT|nr:MAG: hypothetical protein A2765_02590 [Candidatus Kaiserbacteria bacterium RIFCSPHIGHO2_01_FULL_56_24]
MDEQFNTSGRSIRIMPPDLIVRVGAVALGMLVLFLLGATLKIFKEYRYVGSGVAATNTISVSGQGEVFAVPDTGEFSVSVHEDAETVAEAQDEATAKINAIIAYLKGAGVEEKDIKTTNYNVNPKYEYSQAVCTNSYCPPSNQKLVGFEVFQTLQVKVRDTKKAGELLSGVGGKGASEVSGLSFTTDDDNKLKSDAREKAIADAKGKADELAKQLGVSLVRVVGFSEDSGGYPAPYYSKTMAMDSAGGAATPPQLPTGENKITSNVNITYEIR